VIYIVLHVHLTVETAFNIMFKRITVAVQSSSCHMRSVGRLTGLASEVAEFGSYERSGLAQRMLVGRGSCRRSAWARPGPEK
jgi:hypothetical protein